MLDIKELSSTISGIPVLEKVTFSAAKGEVIAVLGAAGSGKSALLSAIAGKLQSEGTVSLNGQSGAGKRNDQVLLYPSSASARDSDSVYDTILAGRAPHKKGISPYSPYDHQIAEELLREFALEEIRDSELSAVSDSSYKMALLAQFISCEYPLLLLDNPEEALDILSKTKLVRTIRKYVFDGNRTVIIATNDLTFASQCAERFIILRRGRILEQGGHELFTDEMLRKVYGCDGIVSKNIFNGRPEIQFVPES